MGANIMIYSISPPQSYKVETATHPYHILPKYPQNIIRAELHTKMCLKYCTRNLREALRQKNVWHISLTRFLYAHLKNGRFMLCPSASVRPSVCLSVRPTVCKPFRFRITRPTVFIDDAKTLWIVSLGCGAAHFVSGLQSVWLCRSYCL